MTIPREKVAAALRHLKRRDPVMRDLIARVGPFRLKLERDRFWVLARAIISQQISTAAAHSIRRRVEAACGPHKPAPDRFDELSDEELRGLGLSGQKVRYLRDLCAHVGEGRLNLRQIGRLSDERVIGELIQVKGIGRWTAQMFLMFSLGRLDVMPHDDLGVRSSLRTLYGLDDLPDRATCLEIAAPWRPYASVACWYCWRSGELKVAERNNADAGYPV